MTALDEIGTGLDDLTAVNGPAHAEMRSPAIASHRIGEIVGAGLTKSPRKHSASSPDGIRTHDLFLERNWLQKSDLGTKLRVNDAQTDQKRASGKRASRGSERMRWAMALLRQLLPQLAHVGKVRPLIDELLRSARDQLRLVKPEREEP
jgi:hypothetical protein